MGHRHVAAAVFQRVAQIPHVSVDVVHFDFVVRQRRARHGVPVHQSFTAVNQVVTEQLKEGLADSRGTHFVHGESSAVPVAGAAQLPQLAQNDGFVFVLPRASPFQKRFATQLQSFDAIEQQSLLNHSLGCDTRVIRAGHPERSGAT